VQRAGSAFLPLDPTLPAARLAQIIQHSGARVVLTTQDRTAALQTTLSGLRRRDDQYEARRAREHANRN